MVLDNNEIQVRNNEVGAHLYLQNGWVGNVFIGDATNFNSSHRLGVDGNAVFLGAVRIGETVLSGGLQISCRWQSYLYRITCKACPQLAGLCFQ
jgi:hypothetical protein